MVLTSLSSITHAGEGGALVECNSASGKTKLSLFSNDGGDRSLNLSPHNPKTKTVNLAKILKLSLSIKQ